MLFSIILFSSISTVSELRHAVWNDPCRNQSFSLTCTVTHAISPIRSYSVCDDTGYFNVRTTNNISLHPGERVRINGHIGIDPNNWQRAFMESVERLGMAEPPTAIEVTPDSLHNESFDNRTVVMHGIVSDVVNDEIDPMWSFLVLRHEKGSFLAAVCMEGATNNLPDFLGATVSMTGAAHVMPDGGKRKFKTPQLTVSSPEHIKMLSPAPENPFAVPQIPFNEHGIANFQYKSASLLSRMNRRCADGLVISILQDRNILLKTKSGQIVGARIDSGDLPSIGDNVSVAGFPETDLFIIKLARAVCKKSNTNESIQAGNEAETEISPSFDMNSVLRENYGRLIRIKGQVLPPQRSYGGNAPMRIAVSCGKHVIPVDLTSCGEGFTPPLCGSMLSVSGICVINM